MSPHLVAIGWLLLLACGAFPAAADESDAERRCSFQLDHDRHRQARDCYAEVVANRISDPRADRERMTRRWGDAAGGALGPNPSSAQVEAAGQAFLAYVEWYAAACRRRTDATGESCASAALVVTRRLEQLEDLVTDERLRVAADDVPTGHRDWFTSTSNADGRLRLFGGLARLADSLANRFADHGEYDRLSVRLWESYLSGFRDACKSGDEVACHDYSSEVSQDLLRVVERYKVVNAQQPSAAAEMLTDLIFVQPPVVIDRAVLTAWWTAVCSCRCIPPNQSCPDAMFQSCRSQLVAHCRGRCREQWDQVFRYLGRLRGAESVGDADRLLFDRLHGEVQSAFDSI